jgi:flagellar basal-body rod protein FlgG
MSRLLVASFAGVVLLVSIAMAWSPATSGSTSGSSPTALTSSPSSSSSSDEGVLPERASDVGVPVETQRVLDRAERVLEETVKVLAHNLANTGTTAFKRRYVVAESVNLTGGGGTRGVVRTDFRQGDLLDTDRPLDLAILGRGFFQVCDETGTLRYTRRGDFTLNASSMIVLRVNGREMMFEPSITIPPDATEIYIGPDGVVSVEQAGQTAKVQVGQLQVALFVNVDGLKDVGGGIYEETEESGVVILSNPTIHGAGEICQRNLEASNVDAARTWREYEDARVRLGRVRGRIGQSHSRL